MSDEPFASIERYGPRTYDTLNQSVGWLATAGLEREADGEWVRYEDYRALLEAYQEIKKHVASIHSVAQAHATGNIEHVIRGITGQQ